MVDLLQLAVYYLGNLLSKDIKESDMKKLQQNAPKPVTRPGQEQEKPRMSSKQEIKNFFGSLK